MSQTERQQSLRLGLVRMSESSVTMIGMVTERFARDEFVIVSPEQAQILIVDADRILGAETLTGVLADYASKPLIVLSSGDIENLDTLRLRKPISVQDLLDALRAARLRFEAAQSAPPPAPAAAPKHAATSRHIATHPASTDEADDGYCGAAADIPPDAPRVGAEYARAHFDDSVGILGTLRSVAEHSRENGRVVSVIGLPDVLYIDATDASRPVHVVTSLDDPTLRNASVLGAAAGLQYFSIAAVPQSARGWRRLRLDTLIWKVSLWSACGRLPDSVNAHVRIRLKAWPNFTRLAVTPHALRIAALWVTRYLSPIEVAAMLGVPQRYVFALCAAAKVAGLLEQEPAAKAEVRTPATAVPAPVAAHTAPAPPRSLLRRILGKLIDAR